jgi:hypothetical protein
MSDKAIFHCESCDKTFTIEFNEVADLPGTICPKCKSDNIFIRDYIFEKEPDRTPIKLGDRGCGTPGRFK